MAVLLRGLALAPLALAAGLLWVSQGLPSVSLLAHEPPVRTSYMRRAITEGRLAPDARVEWFPLSAMSLPMVCGVVKAEDTVFFAHRGFNHQQTLQAIQGRLQGRVVGHSTITMQLARNLFLGPEKTVARKVREVLLTRELESALTKPQLLELYLNIMELGPEVWGVAQASRHYFGKSPSELDAFEGTFFGAIAPAPLQPLEGPNLERARAKQAQLLWRLYVSGLLAPAPYQAAMRRHLTVFQALSHGAALEEALARTAPADAPLPPLPSRRVKEELPPERVLAESCGHRAELQQWIHHPVPKF
ncbi:biosynthetic peptidoglycan transglycosylase [Corallococcus exercitus]|uniref:biosynthetic peptidoglycan transglycosylase n=1 Tax=Corallococcus exercitus TaxID=2316736 RepID=UPI0035D3F9FB